MAFATKYKTEFSDYHGVNWNVYIQEDGFAGTVTELVATGNPVSMEFFGSDDMFSQRIMGSRASIGVYASTDFALNDLFSCDLFEYKVLINWVLPIGGGTDMLWWTGWISPDSHSEPYDCTPYPVTISATDGLGYLSSFMWDDMALTSRQTIAQVIYTMLGYVNITTFTEFVNVFESTMNQTVSDSALLQSLIHWDAFKGETCHYALTEILRAFGAGIRQDQGVFIIYRYRELSDTSMKGRIFTTGSDKSATTRTPLQYINRAAQSSYYSDHNGGMITFSPRYKEIQAVHDYGWRKSILKNPTFPYEEFDVSYDIAGWTKSTDTDSRPLSLSLRATEDYGVYIYDTSATHDHYIYQTLSVSANTNDLMCKLDVGAWGQDESGQVDIEIISSNNDIPALVKKYTYSFATGVGSWEVNEDDDPEYITVLNDTFQASANFQEIIFPIDGIPYTGQLTVRLWNGVSTAASVFSAFKEVGIYEVDSTGLFHESASYNLESGDTGQFYPIEFYLGDGQGAQLDYLQFKNIISRTGSSSRSWETVTAGTGNNEDDPLVELIGRELALEMSRPRMLLDIPLRESQGIGEGANLKLVGNIQDTTNTVGGNNRIFIPAHGTFNVKMREWYLTLMEILTVAELT